MRSEILHHSRIAWIHRLLYPIMAPECCRSTSACGAHIARVRPHRLAKRQHPIDFALDWLPAQALAAYEWLEVMRNRIWLLYGEDIVRASIQRDRSYPLMRLPEPTTIRRSELITPHHTLANPISPPFIRRFGPPPTTVLLSSQIFTTWKRQIVGDIVGEPVAFPSTE